MLKHERGSANPNDTFAISDSNLTVDTNASPNPYSFDNPMLSVNSTSIAGPLTAGMYVYAAAPTREIRFFYNADGLRTRKQAVLGGRIIETTDYTLHGKLVTEMKHSTAEGTDVLHFFYDAQSRPAMVKWNGVMYSYVHNLQGDIVAILDCEGNKVVEYRYDAWGKSLGTDGTLKTSLGLLNPFRYRGYVYDEETGLYYLRSRYYSAEVGRFINGDGFLGQTGCILSHDAFVYALNGPIILIDSEGNVSTVYYFYGKDQQSHAIANTIDLLENDDYAVWDCPVSSEVEFEHYWNEEMMADKSTQSVEIVVINLHGNVNKVAYMNLNNLDFSKNIDTLLLLSCNSGHMHGNRPNFAEQLMAASGNTIRQLIAVDATHTRNSKDRPLSIMAVADSYWKEKCNNPSAKSLGFVKITNCSLGGYLYSSIGYFFDSVKKLLHKVGKF